MAKILREPASAASESYDLVIVGGGIYGAMISLDSSRRGLRSLLLERDDFGGATSFNSMRILHGGLRDLQRFDLRSAREYAKEQLWFLSNFPHMVRILPCLMPLYGNGLRRPSVFRVAFRAQKLISDGLNSSLPLEHPIPAGQVIDAQKTQELFPLVNQKGLKGGAVWYDAFIPESPRFILGLLRWSCKYGATTLNYMEACGLTRNEKGVAGAMAIDRVTGQPYEFKTKIVINAAGPWCREVAASFDRDEPSLFKGSLAWNVLLNLKPLSANALAITGKNPRRHTYFLLPWNGRLLAGTGHAPLQQGQETIEPSEAQLEEFLEDINLAVPSLQVSLSDIIHVFAGLLPVTAAGSVSLSTRPVIFDHSSRGGPVGLYSVSGVKFTGARLVAEKVLNGIFPEMIGSVDGSQEHLRQLEDRDNGRGVFPSNWYPTSDNPKWKDALQMLIEEEAVQHLDDLILRRTNLWNDPLKALQIAPLVSELFNWDNSRREKEIERLRQVLGNGRFLEDS